MTASAVSNGSLTKNPGAPSRAAKGRVLVNADSRMLKKIRPVVHELSVTVGEQEERGRLDRRHQRRKIPGLRATTA